MAIERLSENQLQNLWNLFEEQFPYKEWFQEYFDEVQYFHELSDEDLSSAKNQEKLWRARKIATLGSGESVTSQGAYDDEEIVRAFVELRGRQWPEDAERRATAIQDAYDRILNGVYPKHSPSRPQAKLGRAFAALIPQHLHTGFTWKSARNIILLVLGERRVEMYQGAVLVRDRLRKALGPEADLETQIKRSIFCWWLHEHFQTIIEGKIPVGDGNGSDADKTLMLWSGIKQRKGIASISGYLETYRSVVSAAYGGATSDDIVAMLKSDVESLAEKSCRMVFNRVRNLGFLEHKDGLWYPSSNGEELVEADPPDILVERFLVQTFGLAHTLRMLKEKPRDGKSVSNALRDIYPAWTTNFMPGAITGWAQSLGLIARDDGVVWKLTEYGQAWTERLPRELPTPPRQIEDDEKDVVIADPADVDTGHWPSLDSILLAFDKDEKLKSFIFDKDQIRSLHIAWHSHPNKRFVIISGLSGTGKTALLYHYARIYAELMKFEVEKHRATIAVSPDWRDPTGLLGYFNALHSDPTFQVEPALSIVLAAVANPSLPYFLILDEMNLARVERYFAPFLSSMETGEQLYLHAHNESINGVPPSIAWPRNLFIGGTVNMDETTHPFSDKVLDRAFTFEFWDVDLQRYFDKRAKNNGHQRHHDVEGMLVDVNKILRGVRRHFGYRTAGEILAFIEKADQINKLDEPSRWNLADQAIFSKVLPRLRGEDTPSLHDSLNKISELCADKKMNRCVEKLEAMKENLKSTGMTRFWQ